MWTLLVGILCAKPVEDPVALAAQLARDGEMARAESVISGLADTEKVQDITLLHITKGLIYLHKADIERALESFIQAQLSLESTEDKTRVDNISLYIAQCYLHLREPTKALDTLEKIATRKLSVYLMTTEAYSQKMDWTRAYITILEGKKLFSNDKSLWIQEILVSSKLGLLIPVRSLLNRGAELNWLDEKSVLQLASRLREDGHLFEASLYLDVGRARFFTEELWKASAIVSLERQEWQKAGDILAVLSVEHPSYALETAQAYAQAGEISKALRYNSFAPASVQKSTQRLSLLLQKGAYDLIVPLEKELLRTSTEIEDNIRYGLAYAHFQRGFYQRAKDTLVGISDPKVFRHSVTLQKAIYRCLEGGCL